MAIKISFNGATILRPGAYTKTTVNTLGGFQLADTGIVGIVGESTAGPGGATNGVQSYFVTQLSDLIATYESGPIVDVARALINPARDAAVLNGAQLIRIWKTNDSGLAAASVYNLDTSADIYYNATAANYGESGNLVNYYVADGSTADNTGTITSNADITFPVTISNGDNLVLSINGTSYTLTIAVAPAASMALGQSDVVDLLNEIPVTVGPDTATPVWAAAKPAIFEAVGTTKIAFSIDDTIVTDFSNLHEYAVMSVTTGSSTLDTTLNFSTASTVNSTTLVVTEGGAGPVRGYRGTKIFTFNKNSTTETITENASDVVFSIQYTGTGNPATMNVELVSGVKRLRTTCVGATADNLDILLSNYTVRELVNFINNLPNYTAYSDFGTASSTNSSVIDWYDAINIKTLPLDIKKIQSELLANVNNQSTLVKFESIDEVYGTIASVSSSSKIYLTGGSLGGSSNSDFQDGFDALLAKRCNIILPCASRNATDDITDGLTDPSSTYDIESIVAQTDAHCRRASDTKNRSERNAYVSYKGSFASSKSFSKRLNSEFLTFSFIDVDFVDQVGQVVTKQPHVLAGMLAGIQAGTEVGEPITYKYINALGISHQDYDFRQDIDAAIESGLCPIEEPDAGGFRIVVGNTTYGVDENFTFNRISVLEVAHYVAYNFRQRMETQFVGTGRQGAQQAIQAVYSLASGVLVEFRDAGLLVPDASNNYRGYKNLMVSVNGGTVYVDVTITPLQGIDFVLSRITLDNIRD